MQFLNNSHEKHHYFKTRNQNVLIDFVKLNDRNSEISQCKF